MANIQEIGLIIEKITTSGRKDVEEDNVNKLKQLCKEGGNPVIEQIFHMLTFQMTKNHSQIRYCTLLLFHELFQRSHHFRTLLLRSENLQNFFEAFLGINDDKPLPPPKAWKGELKKKCIECLDFWYHKFRDGYPSLKAAYDHFKSTCIDFREREIITDEERRERAAEEEKRKKNLRKKMEKVVLKFREIEKESNESLVQIWNCFSLLFPGIQREDVFVCEDILDIPNNHLTQTPHNVSITIHPYVEIIESEANKDVIKNLKDIYNQIVKGCLPRLKDVLKSMTEASDVCQKEIKQAIDIKSQIMTALQKFVKLKIVEKEDETPMDENDISAGSSSEDEFEEVHEKEGLELIIPQHRRKEYGLISGTDDLNQPSTSREETGQMCKVPLPNGKLCPRRDAIKCPFHGKIIPRDEMGIPLSEEERKRELDSKKSDVPDWQDPAFLKDIEASIGIDLTVKKRGKGKSKSKNSLLQDIKTCDETPRKRLKKIIFKKETRERVAREMDRVDEARYKKFGDQWNYALEN